MVPMSSRRVSGPLLSMPQAIMPAVMSPPTQEAMAGRQRTEAFVRPSPMSAASKRSGPVKAGR
ncbi:MAG: hypothetical protein ACLUEQ_00770 [Cloacibacillus evryensis]